MRNEVKLTARGELFVDIVNVLFLVGMGYAILRAFAVVVVWIGQGLGVI